MGRSIGTNTPCKAHKRWQGAVVIAKESFIWKWRPRVSPAIGAGSTAMMSCTSCVSELAAKGGLPAAHSYMMQPRAHRSLAVLCGPF